MPSESDVFGAGGAEPAANGAPGGAGILGESGSEESGGAESPTAGSGGASQGSSGSKGSSGSTGAGGAAGSGGSKGSSGSAGTSGSSGSSGFDPTAGLVAYFTFDDASGAQAVNAQDSSKNAKCVGTCTRTAGQLGQAFGLRNDTSPSDWIELPTGIFSGRSAVTLSVWLRDRSTSRNEAPLFHFSSGAKEVISFVPDAKSASASGAHLSGLHSGSSFVDLWSATPVLTDRSWHQVAFSWSSSSIDLYIDGKSVGSNSNPKVVPSQLGTTSPDYLGRSPDDKSLALFGEVDDLRIYDRVLSGAQITQLYKLR